MIAVRDAVEADAGRLGGLIAELGFKIGPGLVEANLAALGEAGCAPLVAEVGGEVAGCLTYHWMKVLHRPRPVGRISMLIVTRALRGRGVGAALVEAAIGRLREKGCGLCEVTSNVALVEAHAFYEAIGFKRTSVRLVRTV